MRRTLELSAKTGSGTPKQKALCILKRQSPKLICEFEYFAGREERQKREFRVQRKAVKDFVEHLAAKFCVAKDLWYVWDQAGMPLTKVGPNVPVSSAYADEELDPDRYQQLIRILDADGRGSKAIVEVRHSLMSALSTQAWYALRLYVLLPPEQLALREQIRCYVKNNHPDLDWS